MSPHRRQLRAVELRAMLSPFLAVPPVVQLAVFSIRFYLLHFPALL